MSSVLLKEQKTDSDVKNYEPEEISSSTVTIDLSHVNKCILYKSMFQSKYIIDFELTLLIKTPELRP